MGRGRPTILVSNDDGVHAQGLVALAAALRGLGAVYVVAPDRERSTVGHALTLHRPLRVETLGPRRYAINGMPSDCVNLGVLGILPSRPDVVVAGINRGSNLGDDVTYSGTVSAAMEGLLLGVPSLAISMVEGDDFGPAGRVARLLTELVLRHGLPPDTLLNVNVPAGEVKGIRLTRLGRRVYSQKVVEETDPRGKTYYWIGGGPPLWEAGEGTDFEAVNAAWVSVTPLHLDLTNHEALRALATWEDDLQAKDRTPGRARRR